ncbi:MAG: hypothetical protein U0931_21300 [Vulcanimicrobiota bacterium]
MNTQNNGNNSESRTIYPHTPQVVRVTPFANIQGSNTVAGVLLRYGPVFIRAFLVNKNEGGFFLSMPGKKNEKGDWWESAYFCDRTLGETFSALAAAEYEKQVGLVPADDTMAA